MYNDGSAIVLKAGSEGQPPAGITIGNATFNNRLNASASGDILVAPDAAGELPAGQTTFLSSATLQGDRSVTLSAGTGSVISAQDLSLVSQNGGNGGTITLDALPGDAEIPGGQITIASGLSASVNAYGGTSADGATGLTGQAGKIALNALGGTISINYASLEASGYGGSGDSLGGEGFGGTIDIVAGYGGSLQTSAVYAYARGDGGYINYTEALAGTELGGTGHGGTINVADEGTRFDTDTTGGQLALGYLSLDATATGGNVEASGTGRGGDAFGGTISIAITRQQQSFDAIQAYARAFDGDVAFDPVGGDISLSVSSGEALNIAGDLNLNADAFAGPNGPAGDFGRGGTIDVGVSNGSSIGVNGSAYLSARAEINTGFSSTPIDSTPDLTGGTIALTANSGSFQATNITADAGVANIGANLAAGLATGGTVTFTASNEGSIRAVGESENTNSGYLTLSAQGYGGTGQSANLATGGTVDLALQSGGSIAAANFNPIQLNADAGSPYAYSNDGVGVEAGAAGRSTSTCWAARSCPTSPPTPSPSAGWPMATRATPPAARSPWRCSRADTSTVISMPTPRPRPAIRWWTGPAASRAGAASA